MVRCVLAALLSVALVACQGEQGPPGPAGTGEGAVSNRYCWKVSGSLLFQYQVVRFASGDAEVICSIADAVSGQHSATTYYKTGDTGITTGQCRLFYDFDTPNGGYWDFRADAPGERATYADPTSATWNGYVETLTTGQCTG